MPVVRYERRGSAALVTIDRPERHNAVDGETAQALLAAFERFCADDDAAALALAEQIAAFPQDTVRSDRLAAIEGFGLPLADGLALEARVGRDRLRTAHDGAARFSERPR